MSFACCHEKEAPFFWHKELEKRLCLNNQIAQKKKKYDLGRKICATFQKVSFIYFFLKIKRNSVTLVKKIAEEQKSHTVWDNSFTC